MKDVTISFKESLIHHLFVKGEILLILLMKLDQSCQVVHLISTVVLRHIDAASNDLESDHTGVVLVWIQDALLVALILRKRHLFAVKVSHVAFLKTFNKRLYVINALCFVMRVRLLNFLEVCYRGKFVTVAYCAQLISA